MAEKTLRRLYLPTVTFVGIGNLIKRSISSILDCQ